MCREQVVPHRVNYLGPIEQTTNLLLAAVFGEVWIREDLAECSAAVVFADYVFCSEFLALRAREEKHEGSGIHVVLLGCWRGSWTWAAYVQRVEWRIRASAERAFGNYRHASGEEGAGPLPPALPQLDEPQDTS